MKSLEQESMYSQGDLTPEDIPRMRERDESAWARAFQFMNGYAQIIIPRDQLDREWYIDEVIQETAQRLLETGIEFYSPDKGDPQPYIATIMHRTYSKIKEKKRPTPLDTLAMQGRTPAPYGDEPEIVKVIDTRLGIEKDLDFDLMGEIMSRDKSELLRLRFERDCTVEQIAHYLMVKKETAHRRVSRALVIAKERLVRAA